MHFLLNFTLCRSCCFSLNLQLGGLLHVSEDLVQVSPFRLILLRLNDWLVDRPVCPAGNILKRPVDVQLILVSMLPSHHSTSNHAESALLFSSNQHHQFVVCRIMCFFFLMEKKKFLTSRTCLTTKISKLSISLAFSTFNNICFF